MVTEVMKRFGSPTAAATCQPFCVMRWGPSAPPTLVAMPLLNGEPWVTRSQNPQNPTYAAAPRVSTADSWLSGSVADDDALASPGWFIVPRSYTYVQLLGSGGTVGLVVSGPDTV